MRLVFDEKSIKKYWSLNLWLQLSLSMIKNFKACIKYTNFVYKVYEASLFFVFYLLKPSSVFLQKFLKIPSSTHNKFWHFSRSQLTPQASAYVSWAFMPTLWEKIFEFQTLKFLEDFLIKRFSERNQICIVEIFCLPQKMFFFFEFFFMPLKKHCFVLSEVF